MDPGNDSLVAEVSKLESRFKELSTRTEKQRGEFEGEYHGLLRTLKDAYSGATSESTLSNLERQMAFVTRKLARMTTAEAELRSQAESGEIKFQDELEVRQTDLRKEAEAAKKRIASLGAGSISKEIKANKKRAVTSEVVMEQLEDLATRARSATSVTASRLRALHGDIEASMEMLSFQQSSMPENLRHAVSGRLQDVSEKIQKIGDTPFSQFTQDPQTIIGANIGLSQERKKGLTNARDEYEALGVDLDALISRINKIKLGTKAPGSGDQDAGAGSAADSLRAAALVNPPRVEMLELKPPPVAGEGIKTITQWQNFVGKAYAHFTWKQPRELQSGCTTTKFASLTPWQRFVYHFLNFKQRQVPGMLFAASAGAGKSWAIALLNSTWLRAGYRSAIITKATLRAEIISAMFQFRADLNINNLIEGHGISLDEVPIRGRPGKEKKKKKKGSGNSQDSSSAADDGLTPEERIRRRLQARIEAKLNGGDTGDSSDDDKEEKQNLKELRDRGFAAIDAMTSLYVYPKTKADGVMSLKQIRLLLNGEAETFIEAGAPKEYPLTRAFIQIDEAHRAVTAQGELASDQQIDYPKLLEMLLDHRENLPRDDWPILALHTATPIAAYACDPVKLLNLFATRAEAWTDFMKGHEYDLEKTNRTFLDMYIKEDGDLTDEGVKKWNKLVAGRVSFISMYGDRSRFAQPDVDVTDVTLSEVQTENALCCLSAGVCPKKSSAKKKKEKGEKRKPKTRRKGGKARNFESPDDKDDEEDEEKEVAPALDDIDSEEEQECALEQVLSPRVTKSRTTSMIEHAEKHAPNVSQIINVLVKNDLKFKETQQTKVSKARTRGEMVSGIPRAQKIFVYVTSKRPKATRTVFELLQENGYHCLNPKVNGKMTLDLREGLDRQYYIDHTGGMSSKFTTTNPDFDYLNGETWSKAMREIFNSPQNLDGKIALIFVSSTLYREGISLRGVQIVYIVGSETSRANLIQGVARAIRFCSASSLPWVPGVGWTVKVYMQRLLWDRTVKGLDASALAKIGSSVTQTLQDANPAGKKFYLAMQKLYDRIQHGAVDKNLFEAINKSGASQIELV